MHRAVGMVQVAGLVVSPYLATAGPNAKRERSHLARLAAEIVLLEQLITSAERQADGEARSTFDDVGLRSTLRRVTQQIDLHLDSQHRQPRSLFGKTDG